PLLAPGRGHPHAHVEGAQRGGASDGGAAMTFQEAHCETTIRALLPWSLSCFEVLRVAGEGGDPAQPEAIEATLLDAGQPTVFVAAASLGIAGGSAGAARTAELLQQGDAALLRRVERLRGAGAVRMGIVERWEDAERLSPYTPFVVLVEAPPPGASWDLSATCVFMQQLHKAYPVTGSVATVAAAMLPGTVPHSVAALGGFRVDGGLLRIGHPTGVMEVRGAVLDGEAPRLLKASIDRTARRIMDGNVHVPWSVWPKQ
ncbi:unnamed protein product, partial [Prorocentrum cordatum]